MRSLWREILAKLCSIEDQTKDLRSIQHILFERSSDVESFFRYSLKAYAVWGIRQKLILRNNLLNIYKL